MTLNLMTHVLIRRGENRDTERCEEMAGVGVILPSPRNVRGWGKEGFFPRLFRENLASLITWLQSPGLQNYDRKSVCYSEPPSLWYLLWRPLKPDAPANEMGIITLICQMKKQAQSYLHRFAQSVEDLGFEPQVTKCRSLPTSFQ